MTAMRWRLDDDALLDGAEASMALGEAGPATWAASAA
jgi:hypothetical protein